MKSILKEMGLILVCWTNVFAQVENPCSDNIIQLPENYYVLIEQIIFADNKIYVNVYDEKHETTALFSDQNGYFIQTIRGKCLGLCKWYEWECGRCGFCNLYELECGNCKGLKAHVKCKK